MTFKIYISKKRAEYIINELETYARITEEFNDAVWIEIDIYEDFDISKLFYAGEDFGFKRCENLMKENFTLTLKTKKQKQ